MLTKDSITPESKVMLPTYVVVFTALGANYLATPEPRLLASPTLAHADMVLDIRGWGILMTTTAVLMVAAWIRGTRTMFRYALLLGMIAFALLGVVFAAGVIANPATSPSAWAWPLLGAAACRASYKSLTRDAT